MTKGDAQIIARIIAVKHGVPLKDAETFVTALFDVINEGLGTDKLVKVKGLGTFKVIDVKDRESVDVNTGERIVIEGRSKITFTPDSVMKDLVNKPFSQFETVALNDGVDFTDMKEPSDDDAGAAADDEFAGNGETADGADCDDIVEEVAEEETPEPESNGDIPKTTVPDIKPEPEPESDMKPEPVQSGSEDGGMEKATEQDTAVIAAAASISSARNTAEPEEPEKEESIDDILQEVAIEQPSDNVVAPVVPCANDNESTDAAQHDDDYADVDEDDVEDDDEEAETCDEELEESGRRSLAWLWISLLVIAVGAGMFFLGYYYGMKSAAPAVNVKPDTAAVVNPSAVTPAVTKDTVAKAEVAKEIKKDSVMAEPVQNTSKEMEQARRIYKTGAYVITGTKETITVKAGQTLKEISGRKLGPDMECYIQVHNNIEEVKAGDELKIPELKLKKKAAKKEE